MLMMAITLKFKNVIPDLVSADQHKNWGQIFLCHVYYKSEVIDYAKLWKLPT